MISKIFVTCITIYNATVSAWPCFFTPIGCFCYFSKVTTPNSGHEPVLIDPGSTNWLGLRDNSKLENMMAVKHKSTLRGKSCKIIEMADQLMRESKLPRLRSQEQWSYNLRLMRRGHKLI